MIDESKHMVRERITLILTFYWPNYHYIQMLIVYTVIWGKRKPREILFPWSKLTTRIINN
jgi:hypothetical protein